jgi:cobalt transporter subunit CbtA
MTGRVILAVLLAGIAAGFIMGAVQHLRLTPFIIQAESFESAGAPPAHKHAAPEASATAEPRSQGQAGHNHAAHDHGEGWAPADGWQRSFATTLTAAMTGAGFAAMLAAVSLLSGIAITRQNGLVWGFSGFLAVTLAPAIGLPPELPGMPAGDLVARQIWWLGTIAATGAGIFLIVTRAEAWAIALAIVVICLPHIIGAPAAFNAGSTVPPGLAAAFAANAIAANAIFWLLIGQFLALALDRTAKDVYAT